MTKTCCGCGYSLQKITITTAVLAIIVNSSQFGLVVKDMVGYEKEDHICKLELSIEAAAAKEVPNKTKSSVVDEGLEELNDSGLDDYTCHCLPILIALSLIIIIDNFLSIVFGLVLIFGALKRNFGILNFCYRTNYLLMLVETISLILESSKYAIDDSAIIVFLAIELVLQAYSQLVINALIKEIRCSGFSILQTSNDHPENATNIAPETAVGNEPIVRQGAHPSQGDTGELQFSKNSYSASIF